jgi:alanine transaminase
MFSKLCLPARNYERVLKMDSIRKSIINAEYAVRGAIAIRGEDIKAELESGSHSHNFKEIIPLNIGNPQAVGQGTISFNRDVISALINPDLMKRGVLSQDVINRVSEYMEILQSPLGAYTVSSKGFNMARLKIAEYISKRDNVMANSENIYLTNGASEGCKLGLRLAIRDESDGVLLPIP